MSEFDLAKSNLYIPLHPAVYQRGNKVNKLLSVTVICVLMAVSVSAFSFSNIFDDFFAPPQIIDSRLSLEKVVPGDELDIWITAKDPFGVNSVSASITHEKGTDIIDFILVEGTQKQGVWQGRWNVHSTLDKKEYSAIITVTSRHNSKANIVLTFIDPIVSHSPDQIIPQGPGSGLDVDKVDGYHAADLLAQGGGGGGTVGYATIKPYLLDRTISGRDECSSGNCGSQPYKLFGELAPLDNGNLMTVRKIIFKSTDSSSTQHDCYAKVIFSTGNPYDIQLHSTEELVDKTSIPYEFLRDGITKIELWGRDVSNSCCGGGGCTFTIIEGYEYTP